MDTQPSILLPVRRIKELMDKFEKDGASQGELTALRELLAKRTLIRARFLLQGKRRSCLAPGLSHCVSGDIHVCVSEWEEGEEARRIRGGRVQVEGW